MENFIFKQEAQILNRQWLTIASFRLKVTGKTPRWSRPIRVNKILFDEDVKIQNWAPVCTSVLLCLFTAHNVSQKHAYPCVFVSPNTRADPAFLNLGPLRPRSHRTRSTLQQAYANYGTHCSKWGVFTQVARSIKGFAHKCVSKSVYANVWMGPEQGGAKNRILTRRPKPYCRAGSGVTTLVPCKKGAFGIFSHARFFQPMPACRGEKCIIKVVPCSFSHFGNALKRHSRRASFCRGTILGVGEGEPCAAHNNDNEYSVVGQISCSAWSKRTP